MIRFNGVFEQFGQTTYTLEKPTLEETKHQPGRAKLINELRRLGFKGKKYVIDEGLFCTLGNEIDGFIGRKFWKKFRVNGTLTIDVSFDFSNEIDYIECAAKAIAELLKKVQH